MDPGERNKRIELQLGEPVGEDIVYYTDAVKTLYAKVVQIQSYEAVRAGAITMPDTIRVTIMYRKIKAEDYRLKYDGEIYNIEGAIDVDGRHEDLELTCTRESHAAPAVERPEEEGGG